MDNKKIELTFNDAFKSLLWMLSNVNAFNITIIEVISRIEAKVFEKDEEEVYKAAIESQRENLKLLNAEFLSRYAALTDLFPDIDL